MIKAYFLLAITIFISFSLSANNLYYLCGPDEDGCFEEDYTSCACIPQDTQPATPHCLNFNTLLCTPIADEPNCQSRMIFPDQAHCLATIFQSMPEPVCGTRTLDFCLKHHIQFCDGNGEPKNCHFNQRAIGIHGAVT